MKCDLCIVSQTWSERGARKRDKVGFNWGGDRLNSVKLRYGGDTLRDNGTRTYCTFSPRICTEIELNRKCFGCGLIYSTQAFHCWDLGNISDKQHRRFLWVMVSTDYLGDPRWSFSLYFGLKKQNFSTMDLREGAEPTQEFGFLLPQGANHC